MGGAVAHLQDTKAHDFLFEVFGNELNPAVQHLACLGQVVLVRELGDQAFPSNWPATSGKKLQ